MRKLRYFQFFVAISSCFAMSVPAMAYDWAITTKVTSIEASYMPDSLPFKVAGAGGSCAAGQLLTWNRKGSTDALKQSNATSVYALLLTALVNNRNIIVYGNNTGCTVDFIYTE